MALRAVDENGRMRYLSSSGDVLKTTGQLVERARPDKIATSTSAAKITFPNALHGLEMTNRSSAIIYSSLLGNEDGVDQVETNSIASAVLLGGDLDVTVTALGMTGSPKTITAAALGTLQVETSVCTTGAVTASGNITLAVTAAGMPGSPKDVVVPVVLNDDTSAVALACRAALAADVNVGAWFDISGTGANIVLTAKVAIANDATMAIAFTDTDTTGAVVGASSDTVAGVAASTAAEIAEIVKDALNADGVIGAFFVATRSGDDVIITAAAATDNDTIMNLAVEEGTASGFTDSPTSANTVEGYVAGDWDELGGSGTLRVEAPGGAVNNVPFTFIWLKASTGTPSVIIRGWKEV